MKKTNSPLILIIIMLLVVVPAAAIDEYAPSLPAMVIGLHTTVAMMQLSIAAYLLTQGISQVISGPLSDRFGRKKLLVYTLLLYLFGSLVCTFAPNATILLIGRILQGLGMGCCVITAPALIGDLYEGEEFVKASSLIFVAYSLVPIIAPVIGGYLQDWYGWRANFALLFIFPMLVLLLVCFKLPETHKPTEENSLHIKQLTHNYLKLFTHPVFMGCCLAMAFLWSILMVFSVIAPFIIQKTFGLSAAQYGHLALLVGVSFLIGNMVSRRVSMKYDELAIGICLVVLLVAAITMTLLVTIWNNVFLIMSATIIITMANGIAFPRMYAKSLNVFPNLIGIASSLVGAIMLLGSVISTALIASLKLHSTTDMSIVYTVLAALCLMIFMLMLWAMKGQRIN